MGEGAVAEATLQRPGEPPEQPADFGGGKSTSGSRLAAAASSQPIPSGL